MRHFAPRHLHHGQVLLDDDWLAAKQARMSAWAVARFAVEDCRRPRGLAETTFGSFAACHVQGSLLGRFVSDEW